MLIIFVENIKHTYRVVNELAADTAVDDSESDEEIKEMIKDVNINMESEANL